MSWDGRVTHRGVLEEAGIWEKGGMEGMGRRNAPSEIEVRGHPGSEI